MHLNMLKQLASITFAEGFICSLQFNSVVSLTMLQYDSLSRFSAEGLSNDRAIELFDSSLSLSLSVSLMSDDEASAENLESESDCNIVNSTKELNCNKNIKSSANVIEASYFNIFKCGRNLLDKLDVTYQSAFTASKKPSPPAEAFTSPLKKILHALTGSQKPSTLSPVERGADYVSPSKQKIWDAMTKNLRK